MHKCGKQLIVALSGACALLAAPAVSSAGEMSDKVIDAIDRGVGYLLGEVSRKQIEGGYGFGQVALETYALVVAGVSVNHPLIRKNFDAMRREASNPKTRHRNNHFTYSLSCYAFALDAAINQIRMDKRFFSGRQNIADSRIASALKKQLKFAVKSLVRYRQVGGGRWNYKPGGDGFDNSNTQFAVLALGVGAVRDVDFPRKVWEEIARYFVNVQQKTGPEVHDRVERLPPAERGADRKDRVEVVDVARRGARRGKKDGEEKDEQDSESVAPRGKTADLLDGATPEYGEEVVVKARGWSYRNDDSHDGYRWNMTCAGLSSIILASRNLSGQVPNDFQRKIDLSIRDGYGWLMKNWKIDAPKDPWKYYGIYSLEKVADLGEVKLFGGHDWYEEVASYVLSKQSKEDGSWPGENQQQKRMNTAFSLLVLNRATRLLTRRAMDDRILFTGSGSAGEDRKNEDDWVYIRSLERELHIPSVLRLLRLRPSTRLLSFVDLVIDNYPPEKRGLLVPGLVRARRTAGIDRIKRYIGDTLEKVTGTRKGAAGFMTWYGQWTMAREAGTRIKKENVPRLIELYGKTEGSVPLRTMVIWALARCQARDAAPLFIEDLSHDEESVRKAAYAGLAVLPLGGRRLPVFEPGAEPGVRGKQVESIVAWYGRARRDSSVR